MTDASLAHPRAEPLSREPLSREPLSPAAIGLAILLHAAAGVAIWWLSPLQPAESQDEPIMVSFDSSPSNVGLQEPERVGPPAESTAANPPPPQEAAREAQQQQAMVSSQPPQPQATPTLPLYEFSIPPVPEPPPAPTSRDFPKPYSAPPARPVQRALPNRPLPPAQQRPATEAPASIPSPLPGPNPADLIAGQGRQRNDYLSRLHRYLAPYRDKSHQAHGANQTGQVVTRVTLARDGSVLNVSLASSSGRPAIDAAELEAIRNAAPFPPLPANMPGDPVVLVLRTTY